MADIFISYAREDAAWAERLAQALERHGYSVWWDRNLVSGARYLKETEAQIRDAKATVVVWSKTSADSHWVADEAVLARDLGRLTPVSIDGTMPPLGFGQYQATDFSRWHGQDDEAFSSLLRALAEKAGRDPPPANPARTRKLSRPVIVAAGVVVALVLAVAVAWATGLVGRSGPPGGTVSVAVMPFADHSEVGDQAHLANGMTGELLSRLRGIDKLTVAGGDWMPALVKELGGDPKALGERLSVTHLLEGDIRTDGDTLRVTARLSTASDGHLVWSKSYERERSGIFAIQDEIASQVAGALSVTLDVGLQSTSYGGTKNFEAYDHYLRGRQMRNAASADRIVAELEQAVAIDPTYARAWNELTIAYGQLARRARTPEDIKPALAKMDQASKQAEVLAPDTWFGHTPRGWYFIATNNWVNADAAHRRALELGDVEDPELYIMMNNFDGQVGRHAAGRRMLEKIRAIDPRFIDLTVSDLAADTITGDYAEAWKIYDAYRAREGAFDGLLELYAVLLAMSDHKNDRVREILARLSGPTTSYGVNLQNYGVFLKAFDSPKAMQTLLRSIAADPAPGRAKASLGAVFAGYFGDEALAVELLRKAYLGPGWAGYFFIWQPPLAETRKTPAFKDFVREVGFVDMWRKSGDWGDYCEPRSDTDFECH